MRKGVLLLNHKMGQCLEILGDPKDLICCGKPTINNVYCDKHYKQNYQAIVVEGNFMALITIPDEGINDE